MSKPRPLRCILLGITTAAWPALCGGILTENEEQLTHIPSWVVLHEMDECRTIGSETVQVQLHHGNLALTGENFCFAADSSWITADCLFCDIDRDGAAEVLLHVWKPGSFGQYQPFWRAEDNRTFYSEHLFIYEWDTARPDRLDPKWMSSAMPVFGKAVTTQADGTISISAPNGTQTQWYWEGWGLVRKE